MSITETILTIADLIKDNEGQLMFAEPVTIKLSPHSWPIRIYGVDLDPSGGVWLFDGETWNQLEPEDRNASVVAGSVLQRLKLIVYEIKQVNEPRGWNYEVHNRQTG